MLYQNKENQIFQFTELDEVNGFIPKDLIRLTDKQLKAYENKPEFGVWNGNEWIEDNEKIEEFRQAQFRAERNQLLIEADIEINKLEDLNKDSSSWRVYRQALRDSTENWVLPTKPEGVK